MTFDRGLVGYHGISISVQADVVAAHDASLGSRVAIYKEVIFEGGVHAAQLC